MEKEIRKVLKEQVNPILDVHMGGAEFVSFESGVLKVKLTGACKTCPSAEITVQETVKDIIIGALPEVTDVILDTSVSQDLIDMARKILNKEV